MYKNYLIYILTFILCVGLANALIISPSSQDATLYSSQTQNLYTNITNDLNETIYLVSLSSVNKDITYVDNYFNLSSGGTRNVKMAVLTSNTYNNNSVVNVIFYKNSTVVNTPTTENIYITNSQYLPYEKEIFSGSTIKWRNNDTIRHTVTSYYFDQTLEPGQEYTYTFGSNGNVDYYDKYTIYNGKIYVKDVIGIGMVHNPREDASFNLHINSILVETELNLTFVEGSNFTVNYGDEKESVFYLTNIGSKLSSGIRLTSSPNWLDFGKNDFIIEAGKQSYVPFTIKPLPFTSNETGKDTQITISIVSNNTLKKDYTLSVFVPFVENMSINRTISTFFNQSFDDNFLMALHNTVCALHPGYIYCKPIEVERVVYKSAFVPYNASVEDIIANQRRTEEVFGKLDRFGKQTQEDINNIKNDTSLTKEESMKTRGDVTALMQKTQDNENSIKHMEYTIICIIIAIGFSLVFYLLYKLIQKKQEHGAEFNT